MVIYGTALLAACHLLGIVLGDLLGRALGMQRNVGGVGMAMLLLIVSRVVLHRRGWLAATSEGGVHYWGAIYIPVVVAMAMTQNAGRQSQAEPPKATYMSRRNAPKAATLTPAAMNAVIGVGAPW